MLPLEQRLKERAARMHMTAAAVAVSNAARADLQKQATVEVADKDATAVAEAAGAAAGTAARVAAKAASDAAAKAKSKVDPFAKKK